jgi:anti-sigma factor RsiW
MTCTDRRELERYALAELDEARAAAVRAHLAGCAACAEEARLLAAERDLFRRRAALPMPAPPPFAAVMARARDGGEPAARGARRARIASALAAAAAVLGLWFEGRTPPREDTGAPAIVAEPSHGEICADPIVTARAVEHAEIEVGACLIATPAAAPAPHEEEENNEECHVTCDGVEPHGEEALESRARGADTP